MTGRQKYYYIGKAGNAELKSLLLREFLEVPELRYNRTDVQVGNLWLACGCGLVESVVPDSATTGVITLKLEENEIGAIAEDISVWVYFIPQIH